ncbi:MAG: AbrB/MazE/SpoVT family DNA-binding domain-containing protein [Polyangiaceae bacterium]
MTASRTPRGAPRARAKKPLRSTTDREARAERPIVARAKLFANGRSQAIRLPKELRLPGEEVLIRKEGQRLIVEPLDAAGWPLDLWDRLDALAGGVLDTWERPADPVPPPIESERGIP